jgi:hypothetical protein
VVVAATPPAILRPTASRAYSPAPVKVGSARSNGVASSRAATNLPSEVSSEVSTTIPSPKATLL